MGYVGLVTAACLADLGHDVICRDIVPERVESLSRGEVPIHEPGLDALLARNRGRLRFTLSMDEVFQQATLAFVCVDTPPSASGDADLSRVESVIESIPEGSEAILIMKSTVPVGTGVRVRDALDRRGLTSVAYASNPEFLREGSAIADFTQPDRVVVGADDPAVAQRVAALYEPLGAEVVTTDIASAEMVKLASNAFLATKISFINEIANVCERVGADVAVVARGMGLDRRIGRAFLAAGIGYGGSCFPKDVTALKQLAGNSGYPFLLLASVIEVNELQKRRVVTKLKAHLGDLRGRTIALLGLAFKPNTDDMREAASIVLAGRLVAEGAVVRGFDPVARERASHVLPAGVELVASMEDAVRGADAAVIVTEWGEFREPPAPRAARSDGAAAPDRRAQPDRPGRRGRRGLHVGGHRPAGRRRGRRVIAVVLVGGAGTRLRPLTLDRPKPMLPIGGVPFLAHLLDRLGEAGVDRVIFSCGYLPSAIEEAFGDGLPGGPALEYAVEPEPLGTAGAIRFAAAGRVDGPFLALNGDVLCDADLAAAMAFHRGRGASATLTLTGVQDPTRYGLVLTDADGAVTAFVEKPDPSPALGEPPYWINAGAYVLDPSVLELIEPGRAVSIEREVFPALVGRGLAGWRAEGYWNDIGTPASFLAANMDVLDGTARTRLHGKPGLRVIDASATVLEAASVGRPTIVGARARASRRAPASPTRCSGPTWSSRPGR